MNDLTLYLEYVTFEPILRDRYQPHQEREREYQGERQTNRQTDRQKDRQADRQKKRKIFGKIH